MKFRYGKNVLITGGTSGIGLAAAKLFAENGYNVYAVSRSAEEKTVYEGNGTITYMKMDVCDIDSIKAVSGKIDELGIIVNCAGYGIAGAAEDCTEDDARRQMDVNYFGVLNVNRVFMPTLRKAGRGMVVIVSSIAGVVPIPFQSHYSSSKYALEAYGEALRIEVGALGIKVTIVEPGDTVTGFTKGRKLCIPENSPYRECCIKSVHKMEKDEQNGCPPEMSARVIYKNACKKNPPVRTAVGIQYKALMALKKFMPSRFINYVLGKLYGGKK